MSTQYEVNLNRTNNHLDHTEGPLGFHASIIETGDNRSRRRETASMKANKAKELAFSQVKNVFATLLSFYFIGTNLSLITIFIVGLNLYNSLSSILSVNQTFKMYENPEHSIVLYKLLYMGIQTVVLSAILYRIYGMGLIPLNPGDWISLIESDVADLKILN